MQKNKETETQKNENHVCKCHGECQNCKNFENLYKRALADYTNLNRRFEDDKIKIVAFANEVLISKLLQVLDDLEEAQKHIKDEGIDKVMQKFKKILEDEGVNEMNPENEVFDPTSHEALDLVDGEKDKVINVHRKGYLLSGKVIRPALVSVGNGEKVSK